MKKYMQINYITNAIAQSGVGMRADAIAQRLRKVADIDLQEQFLDGDNPPFKKWPGALGSKSINWIRMGRRLGPHPGSTVWHLTNQSLSFLSKRLHPSIVTVHDLIEILDPQTRQFGGKLSLALLHKYLYSGITNADRLIAVSEYTKQSIIDYYDIAAETITVIPNGVGPEFHRIHDFKNSVAYLELARNLNLTPDTSVVIYVGSDHPRKNLPTALTAFASVRQAISPAVFIKVGAPGLPAGRLQTLTVIDELKLREHVRFIDNISTEQLNQLYNLADVLIFPSRFEGFGLPPLQAMAAGTPVVTSNSTSIPEVVEDAATVHDPDDIDAFAKSLQRIVTDTSYAQNLHTKGLVRAKHFSWDAAVEQVVKVYRILRP
jgi:glycosyltransferase involved in cell wall biosynthesis